MSYRESADAEFLVQITSLGPEPDRVGGVVPAFQSVGVSVTEVVRGAVSVGDNLSLDVIVFANGPSTTTGASGLPALDAQRVRQGASAHVWAQRAGGGWQALELSTDAPAPTNYNA